jgi:hypothetical protein
VGERLFGVAINILNPSSPVNKKISHIAGLILDAISNQENTIDFNA